MARLEGSGKGNPVCAKSQSSWEEAVEKKRQVFAKPRGAAKVRFEMTRESPFRHMAQKEGLVRPFLFLVSMSPHHRALLSIQLGWCPFVQECFGDPHEESWQVTTIQYKQTIFFLVITFLGGDSFTPNYFCLDSHKERTGIAFKMHQRIEQTQSFRDPPRLGDVISFDGSQ